MLIIYGTETFEVPEGTLGTVRSMGTLGCTGLARIEWDHQPGRPVSTSIDAIDPAAAGAGDGRP
ncbi:MAG: hypothetical protein ACREU5_06985 [Burkholderiales bacterium]